MSGGSLPTAFAQANAADDAAEQASSSSQNSAAVNPLAGYNPYRQSSPATAQSPTIRIPGFQGVANPFYTPTAQPQQQASGNQAASLLDQYNTYRQGYTDQLAASRAADQARLDAQMKAYQDAQAAKKAQAEAAAAEARRQELLMQQQQQSYSADNYSSGGANGGIADLYRGFEK